MRVLVIDDSAFMRKIISGMIEEAPGLEVIGQARNGRQGVEMAEELKPENRCRRTWGDELWV